MLQKCANPCCTVPFRSLREGRLFVSEMLIAEDERNLDVTRRKMRRREHFWLCGACSLHFTLHFDPKLGMLTVPLGERAAFRPSGARVMASSA